WAWVTSVAFSPDGRTLVYTGDDFNLSLRDVATGRQIRTFGGRCSRVHSVAISRDGSRMVSGNQGGNAVELRDMSTGWVISTLKGHWDVVGSVAFSPDGMTALSAGNDKAIKLWDLKTGKEIRTFETEGESIGTIQFAPDGKTAVSGDSTL